MALKEDMWYLLSVAVMAVLVTNFGLRQVGNANADLLEIILGSSRLERFAEAAGYYSPVAVADATTIAQGDPAFVLDVLDNDNFGAYNNSPGFVPPMGLFLLDLPSTISNIQGDTGASISVVNTGTATTNSNGRQTDGELQIDTTDNFAGTLTFDYDVCDRDISQEAGQCATGTVTITVEGPNTPPTGQDITVTLPANIGSYRIFRTNSSPAFLDFYNDDDGDAFAGIRIDTLPGNGVIKDGLGNALQVGDFLDFRQSPGQRLTYEINRGFSGTDSLTYSMYDGTDFALSSNTITYNVEASTPPVAVADGTAQNPLEFSANQQFFIDVLNNDYDEDHYTSTYSTTTYSGSTTTYTTYYGYLYLSDDSQISNIAGDTNAIITVDTEYSSSNNGAAINSGFETNGRVSVIPSNGYTGPLTFDYQMCSSMSSGEPIGSSGCATGTVTVEIQNGANNAPTVGVVFAGTPEDMPYQFNESNFDNGSLANGYQDQDGDPLASISVDSLPTNGSLLLYGQPLTQGEIDDGVIIDADFINPDPNVYPGLEGLQYLPDDDFCGFDSFRWNASDGVSGFAAQNAPMNIFVDCENDIPTVSNFAVTTPYETMYQFNQNPSLFVQNYTDRDRLEDQGGPVGSELIAIRIQTTPNNGFLQVGGVTVNTGDYVEDLASLEYVPTTGFSGDDTFTWVAYDNVYLDVSDGQREFTPENPPYGGPTPQTPSNTATTTITVGPAPVNQPPSAGDFLSGTEEDTPKTFGAADFAVAYSDPESDPLASVRVETLPVNGTLTYAGNSVSAGQEILAAELNQLVYTPASNFNGTDPFDYNASDGSNYAVEGGTVNFLVNALNDAPEVGDFSFTTPYETPFGFGLEEGGSLFSENFSDVDAETANAANEAWVLATVQIVTLPSQGSLIIEGESEPLAVGVFLTPQEARQLRYVPNPEATGADSFEWNGDDGFIQPFAGGAGPLRLQATADENATVNITILEPDDNAPTAGGFSITTEFNQPYDFSTGEFEENFDDPDGDPLEAAVLVDLPEEGTMLYNGSEYAGEEIPRGELNTLRYVPDNGFVGSDALSYQVIARGVPSPTAVIGITVNDYQPVRISLTKDTPDNEVVIDRQVCVQAQVTNPNTFELENVVVRLITQEDKAPFVVGSYRISGGKEVRGVNDSTTQFDLTLSSLAAGETVDISNCVLPKTQDLSVVDGTTFLEGSDRRSEDKVELQPPREEVRSKPAEKPPLVRTGGWDLPLAITGVLQFLILSAVWFVKRWRK